jgi:hypothetical protein
VRSRDREQLGWLDARCNWLGNRRSRVTTKVPAASDRLFSLSLQLQQLAGELRIAAPIWAASLDEFDAAAFLEPDRVEGTAPSGANVAAPLT